MVYATQIIIEFLQIANSLIHTYAVNSESVARYNLDEKSGRLIAIWLNEHVELIYLYASKNLEFLIRSLVSLLHFSIPSDRENPERNCAKNFCLLLQHR